MIIFNLSLDLLLQSLVHRVVTEDFRRQNLYFTAINLAFDCTLNIVATSGLSLLLYISKF